MTFFVKIYLSFNEYIFIQVKIFSRKYKNKIKETILFCVLIKKGIDVNMIKRRKILSLFLASVMALGSVNTSYIAHANTINKVSLISLFL